MKIISIMHNWRPVHHTVRDEGENYDSYNVGKDGVVEIREHFAQGEGDKWYYDVEFENGNVRRLFNPNSVSFQKE